ncbi:phage baseplate assembly protein V [Methylophilus sp. YYY-1]|uniref:phage baseplate assembly protein V n=1 Tax=Methylophilus sp. YYY-1 TaxID=2682087 RepID=UPI0023B210EA|nr:phage baseplate assembly protein V [Methylophilus sp. YYY-1]MDF0377702.1 phage baseplate assembly protein V [Methylophilus sp. YYY-1]
MWADVDKRIKRALGSMRLAFRGRLMRVNTSPSVALVQGEGLKLEKLQDNELFQDYGFTSNPPPGTEGIVLPIGGKTVHGIVIATEHGSYRLTGLKSGEVALYTMFGDSIVLRQNHEIEIVAASELKITCPLVTISGDLKVKGDIIDKYDTQNETVASMRDIYNSHTHNDPQGGSVSTPNGLM